MNKRPCCRCLLWDLAQVDMDEVIHFFERLSPKHRIPQPEYEVRLNRCRQCAFLQTGTCMQCGCYAEIRAAQKGTDCPLRYW